MWQQNLLQFISRVQIFVIVTNRTNCTNKSHKSPLRPNRHRFWWLPAADARVDDHEPAPHPRRGHRRRERHHWRGTPGWTRELAKKNVADVLGAFPRIFFFSKFKKKSSSSPAESYVIHSRRKISRLFPKIYCCMTSLHSDHLGHRF